MYAIAIHGGAGAVPRATLSPEREQRYRAGLEAALAGGYAVLERGGSSLDAVTAAVCILEDDPCFNAGRGAALTRDGAAELDAAVMDGRQQRAGAVASVRHVKNPVELARRVMEKSRNWQELPARRCSNPTTASSLRARWSKYGALLPR